MKTMVWSTSFDQPDGWESDDTTKQTDEDDDDGDTDLDDDDDDDDSSTESVIIVESTRSPTDNESMSSRPEGMGRPVAIRMSTDETVSELTGTTGKENDPDLASPPRKKGRSQRVSVNEQATAMERLRAVALLEPTGSGHSGLHPRSLQRV